MSLQHGSLFVETFFRFYTTLGFQNPIKRVAETRITFTCAAAMTKISHLLASSMFCEVQAVEMGAQEIAVVAL